MFQVNETREFKDHGREIEKLIILSWNMKYTLRKFKSNNNIKFMVSGTKRSIVFLCLYDN